VSTSANEEPFILLLNPRAGAGRAGARRGELEEVLRQAGAHFETWLTTAPGDATQLVRKAIAEGAPGVAVVGGDGTLSEAAGGYFDEEGQVVDTETWLGPLPCGTGGDFRKTLGLGRDPVASVAHMMAATPRRIDLGYLRHVDDEGEPAGRAFLNIASCGVGGLVDRLVNEGPKWMGGAPAFFLGTLRALSRYTNRRVSIRLDDGEPREASILNLAVANGRFFGGGMQVAPQAELDDGLFDVVGVESEGLWQQLAQTPHLYRGTLLGRKGISYARAKQVVVEPADEGGPILLDVDGEAPGALPARFEMHARALPLRG